MSWVRLLFGVTVTVKILTAISETQIWGKHLLMDVQLRAFALLYSVQHWSIHRTL